MMRVSRLNVTGAVVTVLVLVAGAFSSAAAARTVRTFAIRSGVTSVRLAVPHSTGSRPPAILLSTRPADLRCSVLSYRYHAIEERGTFGMRMRCRKVGSGARGRVVFRRPYVRVFKLHNGTGTIRVRLDKFPGSAAPLGQLTTRPHVTNCSATPTGRRVGKHVFTARARVSCHGLPHDAKAVLAVGGLLAPSPSSASRSADLLAPRAWSVTHPPAKATVASVKPCSSPRTLSLLGHSISWRYCYGAGIDLGPWKSAAFGQTPTQNCPPGWVNDSQVQPSTLRIILGNYYPAAVSVEPATAWAWSYSYIFGLVTNWQFSGSITAMWSWNCYQIQ
jgi:hypothetical protein